MAKTEEKEAPKPPPPTSYERLFALREALLAVVSDVPPKTDKQSAIQDNWRIIHAPCAAETSGWLAEVLKPVEWVWEGTGTKEKAVRILPIHLWAAITHQFGKIHASLGGAANRYARSRVVWNATIQFGVLPGHNAPIGSEAEIAAQKKDAETKLAAKAAAIQASYKATLAEILSDWTTRRQALLAQAAEFREIVTGLQMEEEERLAGLVAKQPAAAKPKGEKRVTDMKNFRRAGALKNWGSNLDLWSQQRHHLQEEIGDDPGKA